MTTIANHVPVLIAGGGPSGLSAAIELGRRGVEVLVVEPRVDLDPLRARAKTTSARTMEHLRRWGLADRLRQAAPLSVDYAQDVVFCTGLFGHEISRFSNAFALFPERKDELAESGQQAPQPVVEELLRVAAGELPTVQLLIGWTVTSMVDGVDRVSAVLEAPDGDRREVTADWLLGCDGSRGISRAAIGARYEGSAGIVPNLSITFRSAALEAGELCALAIHYWVIGAQHGGLMGRLDRDGTWWAIVQGVDTSPEDVDAAALVRELAGADIDVEVLATDPWSARMLLVDRYRGQRIFLVGDTAHLNPPWGGHGFNTCVGDAVNIGWKLAAVIQGWAPTGLLDSYQPERRPVAERTIAAAGDQEAFLAPSFAAEELDADSAIGAALRATVAGRLRVKDPEFHSLGLVLGYDYADSPVVVPDGLPQPVKDVVRYTPSAHPGARLPHHWLPDGSSVYDLLGDGFTLLQLDADADVGPLVEVAERMAVPLHTLDLSGFPRLRVAYEADLLLVRPDQHVAWRGGSVEAPADLLARVLGMPVGDAADDVVSTGTWAGSYVERVAGFALVTEVDWLNPSEELAAAGAGLFRPFGEPEPTRAITEAREIPGPNGPVAVRIYRHDSGETSGAGLVWCHGGAFVGGDLDMPEADLVARGLVTRTRCVVVSVDYRLCHNGIHHPIPHDDVWSAFTWTREHAVELGIEPDQVAIGGASAGGNLAASVGLRSRDVSMPAWQVLLAYPIVHPWLPEPSAELSACLASTPAALRFDTDAVAGLNQNYLGRPLVEADPYAFAALAVDLTGYPSTYIENAEFDDLRASGEDFARLLVDSGVDVATVTAAGVPHGHLNAIGSPFAQATLDRLAARLGTAAP